LSLSGCEDLIFCKTFESKLIECYPDLTNAVTVVSDTLAPIALACESGIQKKKYLMKIINCVKTLLIRGVLKGGLRVRNSVD